METLLEEMFLVLIPAQYLHVVVQLDGIAILTKFVLDMIGRCLSAGEAAPISHGNPLTVHFIVMVSKMNQSTFGHASFFLLTL